MSRDLKGNSRAVKGKGQRAGGGGWREGTVKELLGLTEEQSVLVRTKAALAVFLQQRRKQRGWCQAELATRMSSGQSRVAKMEAAHSSVSLDLLVKALLVTGATMPDVAAVMASGDPDARAPQKHPAPKRQRSGGRTASAR